MANKLTAPPDKAVYTMSDIAERYAVGSDKAYRIMRQIAFVNDGLTIPHRALWSEIEYYEARRGRRPGSDKLPTAEEIETWHQTRMPEGADNEL